MTAGLGAEAGDNGALPLSEARGTRPDPMAGVPSRAERLGYITTMMLELRAMVADAGCRTPAGLLDLTHQEAIQLGRSLSLE